MINKFRQIKKKFVKNNKDLIKPQDYTKPLIKKIYRTISIIIAKPLYKYTKISANQVTTLTNIISLFVAYIYFLGEYKYIVWIAFLYLFNAEILDMVDGNIARITKTASPVGNFYDHLSDWMSQTVIFLGMTWGVYNKTLDWRIWIFGFLAATSYIYARAIYIYLYRLFPDIANNIVEKEKKNKKIIKNFFYDGGLVFMGVFIASLLNLIGPLIIFFGIYGWIYCIVSVALLMQKLGKIKQISPVSSKKKEV